MTIDYPVAMPGDDDLDCHLSALRIADLIPDGIYAGDPWTVTVGFTTDDAGGSWSEDSIPRLPGGPVSVQFTGGDAERGGMLAVFEVLREWAADGTFLELTMAPGKQTRLRGADRRVVLLPRTAKANAGGKR